MTIGAEIRRLRLKAGLTITGLADRARCCREHLSIQTGDPGRPKMSENQILSEYSIGDEVVWLEYGETFFVTGVDAHAQYGLVVWGSIGLDEDGNADEGFLPVAEVAHVCEVVGCSLPVGHEDDHRSDAGGGAE